MGQFDGFSKVKLTRPQRSTFDLTHDKRLSARMGKLTPVLALECVPSDSFNGSSEMLVRLAPLLAPIYDQIEVYVHYFFIPNRLLWEDWEEFITGGRLGVGIEPLVAPIPPQFDIADALTIGAPLGKSSIADYLGVPVLPVVGFVGSDYDGITLDAMPFAAYQKVYMDYYRDRNYVLDDTYVFPLASGVMTDVLAQSLCQPQVRAWRHDYFNSSLPFTQRGEEVLIPIEGEGSVTYLDTSIVRDAGGGVVPASSPFGSGGGNPSTFGYTAPGFLDDARLENIDEVLLTNSSTTINDFRSAYALQVWLERNAVGGSRYTESTQAHFGVRPQDMRLQRAEYIGGGRIPVKISEVLASSYSVDQDDNVIPLANMGGHGVTYGNTNQFKYFCVEHGFILGLMSIMAPPSYHQGLPRMFRRRSFLDYPWPTFAKLGEQQVDAAEIFASPDNLTEDVDTGELPLWGYQSRYADWKYMCNWNHGDFHDTLLFWTLTNNYDEAPTLSNDFVSWPTGLEDRIFAVQGAQDHFWIYCHNNVHVKRPLPYFGTPNTMGFV